MSNNDRIFTELDEHIERLNERVRKLEFDNDLLRAENRRLKDQLEQVKKPSTHDAHMESQSDSILEDDLMVYERR